MKRRLRTAEVSELRDKYERMLVLREAHERARVDPTYAEPDPRKEMKELATTYPGSLREIDVLSIDEIARRISVLSQPDSGSSSSNTEPWILAQTVFHSLARGALVTKRWLRGRKRISSAMRASFLEDMGGENDARLFADELTLIANPPRGRLMDVVFAKVATTLHVTEAEARSLVFGETRKPR